jgi:hypothetical protein
MINVNDDGNGTRVEIKGSPIQIQAELRCIAKSLLDGNCVNEDAYVVGVISPLFEKFPKEKVFEMTNNVCKAVEKSKEQMGKMDKDVKVMLSSLLEELLGE